jgi:hypothetical protein
MEWKRKTPVWPGGNKLITGTGIKHKTNTPSALKY